MRPRQARRPVVRRGAGDRGASGRIVWYAFDSPSMPDPRSREKAVGELHRFAASKQLRILVGNGVSIPSGFPAWDSLNLGLLEVLIRADSKDRNLWAGLI